MTLLSGALDRRDPTDVKGRALLTLDLAQCHAAVHEPEEAARLAGYALDTARGTLVEPILARAQTMRLGLQKWADMGPVRDLNDRMSELSREK